MLLIIPYINIMVFGQTKIYLWEHRENSDAKLMEQETKVKMSNEINTKYSDTEKQITTKILLLQG